MRPLWNKTLRFKKAFRQLIAVAAGLLLAAPAPSPRRELLRGKTPSACYSRRSPALSLAASHSLQLSSPASPSPSGKAGRSGCLPVCSSASEWPSQRSISCRGSFPAVESGTSLRETHMAEARRINRVHRSLSRPLTILGAERKLFFFAMCLGAATFNLLNSLLSGLLMFLLLYFMARWATQTDPQILRFLLAAARLRAQYDPMKFTPIAIRRDGHAQA